MLRWSCALIIAIKQLEIRLCSRQGAKCSVCSLVLNEILLELFTPGKIWDKSERTWDNSGKPGTKVRTWDNFGKHWDKSGEACPKMETYTEITGELQPKIANAIGRGKALGFVA